MNDHDDARIIFDDTRRFTRGRSAYHADPSRLTHQEREGIRWTLIGLFLLVAIVAVVVLGTHFFGPQTLQ